MFIILLSRPAPKNEEEMMVLIFEYIDRLMSVCRPRRLLYMAIDGVVSWKIHLCLHCLEWHTWGVPEIRGKVSQNVRHCS